MQETPEQQMKTTPAQTSYEEYGCKVNAISADQLFRKYEDLGFLYPEKMQRLAPFMPLVIENWEKALAGGELVHYVVSVQQPDGAWASITSWRSTWTGWNTQHLVGHGPSASRAVMLATCAFRTKHSNDLSHQNWFQRSNRFANKIFGSISQTLGSSVGWVGDYSYFGISPSHLPVADKAVTVREAEPHDGKAIRELAAISRSSVFVASEALDQDDLFLEAVDQLYRRDSKGRSS